MTSRLSLPRLRALRMAAAALSVAMAASRPIMANGAFPDEFSIHFPADAPHRIYLGANFGLLVSEDDGRTWRYSCEPWVVSGSNAALAYANVSFYQVTADGALIAGSIDVTRSSDVACTWPASTGAVHGVTVADFFPDPNDATFVLAIVTTTSASYLVASHDGGKSFDSPHLLDTPDLLTGVEISRSKPGLVYATSLSTATGSATFWVSADRGTSWTKMALPIPSGSEPRILGIDPVDEKKVYLRLLGGSSDAMAMTADGGTTFQTVLTVNTQFSSFLRAGDGSIYLGTRTGTLYVQPPGATSFTSRSAPHLRCLGQRPGTARIYACSDMVVDGYSLASSDDNGKTFQPMMSFVQLLGPLTCAPVQTNCAAHWNRIQAVLGISADAGPAADGGSSARPAGGSHCATSGAGAWTLWLALAFLQATRWRQRRRRIH